MELLKDIFSFLSIVSVFGLYVIRSENKIKTLELDAKLTKEINENKRQIAKLESESALKIKEIQLQSSHTEVKLEEVKSLVSEIYKRVVGENHGS
ncbi:MAG: hypothetical protein O9264_08785 [Leptospira sp.]|nr:hypothetical protein [Leptospira sp.]